MRLNRRSILAGSALAATSLSGIRRPAQAQTGGWVEKDLIQLEGELTIDDFSYFGSINDLNDSGEVGGALIASETKISPTVWAANGKGKRLKSGEFGGVVNAVNNNGIAAGVLYNVFGGSDLMGGTGSEEWRDPGIWVDGELIQLELPGRGGSATAVNDDGIVVGWFQDEATSFKRGFSWQSGSSIVLPETADEIVNLNVSSNGLISCLVFAIQDSQQLFGSYQLVDDSWEPFPIPSADISAAFSDGRTPDYSLRGITDSGAALMWANWSDETTSVSELFTYLDGAFEKIESPNSDLPNLGRSILGDDGSIIARASASDSDEEAWYLWSDGVAEEVTALFTADGTFESRRPIAINRNGQILVSASNAGESPHGLILSRG